MSTPAEHDTVNEVASASTLYEGVKRRYLEAYQDLEQAKKAIEGKETKLAGLLVELNGAAQRIKLLAKKL